MYIYIYIYIYIVVTLRKEIKFYVNDGINK